MRKLRLLMACGGVCIILEAALFVVPFWVHGVSDMPIDYIAGSHFDWKSVSPFSDALLSAVVPDISILFAMLPIQAGAVMLVGFVGGFVKRVRAMAFFLVLSGLVSFAAVEMSMPNIMIWYFD